MSSINNSYPYNHVNSIVIHQANQLPEGKETDDSSWFSGVSSGYSSPITPTPHSSPTKPKTLGFRARLLSNNETERMLPEKRKLDQFQPDKTGRDFFKKLNRGND